jgi:hypothetical protein
MTTATLPALERPTIDRSGGGKLTLGQHLAGVWEGLSLTGSVDCPVCQGEMVSAEPGAGVCRDCGTHVS